MLPVITEPTASGGVTVRLSNEECTPGGTSEAIGKATEVMVSDKPDLAGATWEPFATTKTVSSGGNVFVRYRDAKGRETVASTGGQGSSAVTVTAASAATSTLNQATPSTADKDGEDGLFAPKPHLSSSRPSPDLVSPETRSPQSVRWRRAVHSQHVHQTQKSGSLDQGEPLSSISRRYDGAVSFRFVRIAARGLARPPAIYSAG